MQKRCKKAFPSEYLRNFWKTLEMPLINREINLMLTWSANCFILTSTDPAIFAKADTKLKIT